MKSAEKSTRFGDQFWLISSSNEPTQTLSVVLGHSFKNKDVKFYTKVYHGPR